MNAYEPAAAYHRSVRLLYQIIDLVITQKYEPYVINMVKSRNYHFENHPFGKVGCDSMINEQAPHRLYATQDNLDKLVISSTMCS